MNERIDSRDNNLFNANATLSYDIMKNLKVTLRSGFDNYDNGTENLPDIIHRTYSVATLLPESKTYRSRLSTDLARPLLKM